MYTYVRIYMYAYMCEEHIRLSPFSVTYMYMCLGMITWDWITHQGPCQWRRLNFSLSCHYLSVALNLGVGICEISSIHVGMPTGVYVAILLKSHGIASWYYI